VNVISAILQIGAVVFAVVATIAFNWAEARVLEERESEMAEPDLSDVPCWDDDEETAKAKRRRMHLAVYGERHPGPPENR